MGKINYISELKSSILLLETKQAEDAILLKAEFNHTYNSLKPINLAKIFLKEITTTPELKENIIDTTMSLGAGYLSKKLVVGSTHNPIKNILGSLIQMGVSNIVFKNADGIKSTVSSLISKYITKHK